MKNTQTFGIFRGGKLLATVDEAGHETPGEWAERAIARAIEGRNRIAETHGARPRCLDRGVLRTPRSQTRGEGVMRGARMLESVSRGECGFRGRTVLYAAEEIFRGVHGGDYGEPLRRFWQGIAPGAMGSLHHY